MPAHYDYNRHGYQTLHWPDEREEAWPGTAFVRASHLNYIDRRNLEKVMWELEKPADEDSAVYKRGLLARVSRLLDRPVQPPYVAHRVLFPDASWSNDGEKYLLHRWSLKREKWYHLVFTCLVWLVVTAADSDTSDWRVVQNNICPKCGREVRAGCLTNVRRPITLLVPQTVGELIGRP